jgi:hypothetical protein
MTINLSKIEKKYKSAISEIPENRLKELYDQLLYQAYHCKFIKKDNDEYYKALNLIKTLNNENEPHKVFRASREAIVEAPLEVLIELYNTNIQEKRDFWALMYFVYLLGLASEIEFSKVLIEYIVEGLDPEHSLKFVRKMMEMVREKTIEQLTIHKDDLNRVINFYESKKNLADHEREGLKKLKEIRNL